jgi:hypothetical protein
LKKNTYYRVGLAQQNKIITDKINERINHHITATASQITESANIH